MINIHLVNHSLISIPKVGKEVKQKGLKIWTQNSQKKKGKRKKGSEFLTSPMKMGFLFNMHD